jgi:hypothetical protein
VLTASVQGQGVAEGDVDVVGSFTGLTQLLKDLFLPASACRAAPAELQGRAQGWASV